jgi:ribonuclease T2
MTGPRVSCCFTVAAALVVAFLLLLAVVERAEAAPVGWTLALSWEPGFCATAPKAVECLNRNDLGLVLHGLWPEGGDGGSCAAADRGANEARTWCQLPELYLSAETKTLLRRAMPGAVACLDRHEWLRHGSCSGMSPEDYFRAAANLVVRANGLAVAQLLRERKGQTVTVRDLRQALAKDMGVDAPAVLRTICATRQGRAHLVELRLSLSGEGLRLFPKPESLARSGKHGGERCPVGLPLMVDE